jgi:hypothetical protein
MALPTEITAEQLRSLRYVPPSIRADLLAVTPMGIRGHLIHALEAVKHGNQDEVKRFASRAYQLGYELCDPVARRDAEMLMNAVGLVVE